MRRFNSAKSFVTAAACFTLTSPVWAGPQLSNAPDASPKPVAAPLSSLINGVPVGAPLEPTSLTAFGWVEGSWTYDASSPPGNIISGRVFDTRHESLQLDQVGLVLQRRTDYQKPFDVGFIVEQIYGWDSAYFHSNGLTIQPPSRTAGAPSEINRAGSTATIRPKAQYDLTQANVVLSTNAVAKGLGLEVGKFDTLLGAEPLEAFNPNPALQGPFFSKSFIFTQEPFTQTGALVILQPTQTVTLTGGVTNGWDQSTRDNNGSADGTAQLQVSSGKLTATLTGVSGPEEPTGAQNGWRTMIDTVETYKLTEKLKLTFNGMYAWEPQTSNGGAGGGTGMWYGAAAYASYQLNDELQLNVRGEWFNDPDGAAARQFNTALPVSAAFGRPVGRPNNYTEATFGATIQPLAKTKLFKNLTFRPEVRGDYANHATWDAGTGHFQLTAEIEGYYAF